MANMERPDGGRGCYPTNFERRLLVWYKKYPSLKEVPPTVAISTVNLVRNKARIHFSMLSMVFFSFAFLATALEGKRLHREGKGVTMMNQEWHRQFRETGEIGDIRQIPEGKPDVK